MMMAQDRMTSKEFRESGLQIRTSGTGRADYKQELLRQIKEADLPEPQREVLFHKERKWRFDFFFEQGIAVEYEGGVFDEVSGHKSVSGILRDIEKYNEAALAGFTVIRVTAQTVASGLALKYIRRALKKANSSAANAAKLPGDVRKVRDAKSTLKELLDRLERD